VGNMGSAMRMNYTMMGDPVNLAARLEAAGKQYGVCILVSEHALSFEFADGKGTLHRVRDMVETRFIDTVAVVGKAEPVRVYELWAMKGDLTPQEEELARVFGEGMRRYLHMEWDAAIGRFSEALALERFPEDKTTPSAVYIERCRRFREDPPAAPGEAWDGVFRLTQK